MSNKSTARQNYRSNYRAKVLAWVNQGFTGKVSIPANS